MSNDVPLEIDCRTVRDKLTGGQGFLLIDCRELDEHRIAAITGATLLPMSEIESRARRRWSRIGRAGHRPLPSRRPQPESGPLAARARASAKAQSMAGGIDDWSREDRSLAAALLISAPCGTDMHLARLRPG